MSGLVGRNRKLTPRQLDKLVADYGLGQCLQRELDAARRRHAAQATAHRI